MDAHSEPFGANPDEIGDALVLDVRRAAAMQLRAAGLNARFLRGGIDGWQTAGLPLVDKPGGAPT